jgi:hypothetical protein
MRIALLALLVTFSTTAFASENPGKAAGDATPQTAQSTKNEALADQKICRRIDASESRLASKRVCLTAEQWKQRDESSSDW